jgi:hypothetical protein
MIVITLYLIVTVEWTPYPHTKKVRLLEDGLLIYYLQVKCGLGVAATFFYFYESYYLKKWNQVIELIESNSNTVLWAKAPIFVMAIQKLKKWF